MIFERRRIDMHALIVGKRYQGKSTLALSVAMSNRGTVIVWDPNAQYRDLPHVRIDAIPGVIEKYGDIAIRVTRDDYQEAFHELGECLWDFRDYCLLIDEASTLQTPQSIDPMLKRYVTRAPASVAIIQTAHRISDFNQASQAQATDLFFFRTTAARDLDRIEDEYGPGVRDSLPRLGPYELMHYWRDSKGGMEYASRWSAGEIWFIEIGREDGQILDQVRYETATRREREYGGSEEEKAGSEEGRSEEGARA